MPIYGQIHSFGVTQVLIVVVRYIWGVKLGVGGLITAYRTAAQTALDAPKVIVKTINLNYLISFEYKNMNRVMQIIKENNIVIVNQVLELDCHIQISVRLKEANHIFMLFDEHHEIDIEVLND